jgi:hypothetical protein
VKIIAKLRNNGKTSAYSVHGSLHVIAARMQEDQAYKVAVTDKTPTSPRNVLSNVFLSPGAGVELRNEAHLDSRFVPQVKDGTVTVWIFGEVHYQDVFKIPHQLDFCFKYNAGTHFLDVCSGHNFSK